MPKLANRTPLALVIDSLLVRTANYAIADRDGSHLMLFDKFENLAGNAGIATNVATIHPTSLSQEVGTALGAQAGEAKLREVITARGFASIRRATQTPFNMILEARL